MSSAPSRDDFDGYF